MTTIDKAIKTQFNTEQEKALANILYSGNHIKHLLYNLTRPFQLNSVQYQILMILSDAQGIPLSFDTISDRIFEKEAFSHRQFDKLLNKDLIEKIQDDYRDKVLFRVTEGGMNMAADLERRTTNYLDPLKRRINMQEARMLNYILDKLRG
jgi:DNA-binding MarR family transcriptional regulator